MGTIQKRQRRDRARQDYSLCQVLLSLNKHQRKLGILIDTLLPQNRCSDTGDTLNGLND